MIDQHYPKWIYASGGRSKIVRSVEEHAEHEGWVESPAAVIEDGLTPTVTGVAPAAVTGMVMNADATVKRFYTVPVKVIADQVMGLSTLEEVREVRDIEDARPGGPRKGVLQAVLARMEQLAAVLPDAPVN